MSKKEFFNLAQDLIASSLFAKDEVFSSITKSCVHLAIQHEAGGRRQFQYTTSDVLSGLDRVIASTTDPIIQEMLRFLHSVISGKVKSVPPMDEDILQQIKTTFFGNVKDAEEQLGENYKTIRADINSRIQAMLEESIQRFMRGEEGRKLEMSKTDVSTFAKKVIDDISQRYETNEEFQVNYQQDVSKAWQVFPWAIHDAILGINAIGYSKKVAKKAVYEAFLSLPLEEYLDRTPEQKNQTVSEIASILTRTAIGSVTKKADLLDFVLIKKAQTERRIPLWETAKRYAIFALLNSVYSSAPDYVKTVLDSTDGFRAIREAISSYDQRILRFFRSKKSRTIDDPRQSAEADSVSSVTQGDLTARLKELSNVLREAKLETKLTFEEVYGHVKEAVSESLKAVLQEPWADFPDANLVARDVQDRAEILSREINNATERDPTRYASILNSSDRLRAFVSLAAFLLFVLRAQTMKRLAVSDENLQNRILDARKALEEQFPFWRNIRTVSVISRLDRAVGSAGFNREMARSIYNSLREIIQQKIMSANKDHPQSHLFDTIAQNIENPAVVRRYLGDFSISVGDHMDARMYLQRLRTVPLDANAAVQYLLQNIEQTGQTATTGQPWNEKMKEYPRDFANKMVDEETGETVVEQPSTSDIVWTYPATIGLSSAILYTLYLESSRHSLYYNW